MRGDAIDSVAVLPFVNDSGNPDSEYLSDGITESLIRTLSQFPSLRVPARSTVFRYQGKEYRSSTGRPGSRGCAPSCQVGCCSVATRWCCEPSWWMSLTDHSSGRRAHEQGRQRVRAAGLPDAGVSDKLRLRLTIEDKQLLTKRYSNDNAAYQLYLQGRYHRNKMSPEGLRKSIEFMNQAVEKDPRFAMAYAGLAGASHKPDNVPSTSSIPGT